MPAGVDHVEIEDDLDVARSLERRNRFTRGHVLGEGKDLRVHDAAGRPLFVFEQIADVPSRGTLLHHLEDHAGQVLRQVVDDGRGVVGRQLLQQLDDLFGRAVREELGARLGTELAQALHRELAAALGEQVERGMPFLVGELGEELRQIGRVLLLEQVHQVGGRPHAHQTLHGVEHDIELALRHQEVQRAEREPLNVARGLGSLVSDGLAPLVLRSLVLKPSRTKKQPRWRKDATVAHRMRRAKVKTMASWPARACRIP